MEKILKGLGLLINSCKIRRKEISFVVSAGQAKLVHVDADGNVTTKTITYADIDAVATILEQHGLIEKFLVTFEFVKKLDKRITKKEARNSIPTSKSKAANGT